MFPQTTKKESSDWIKLSGGRSADSSKDVIANKSKESNDWLDIEDFDDA